MTDRGTSTDNNKRKEQASSSSSLNKPNKRMKGDRSAAAIPIEIPTRDIPKPIQSISANKSRRTKHAANNRISISSSSILEARNRAALKGQTTLQRYSTNNSRTNPYSIDDSPTGAHSSSHHRIGMNDTFQETSGQKHKIFPRVNSNKMKTPSRYDDDDDDVLSDNDGKHNSIILKRKRDSESSKDEISSDTEVIDIVKKKKTKSNRVLDSSDADIIHIESDDEGIIQMPRTSTKPTAVSIALQNRQDINLNTVKRNDALKTSLIGGLLGKDASTSSGGFTEMNTKANPSKSKSSSASNIFTKSSYHGANSPPTQKSTDKIIVKLPDFIKNHQKNKMPSGPINPCKSDVPFSNKTEAWRSSNTPRPTTRPVSLDRTKKYVKERPLSSYIPSPVVKKPLQATKEIIELDDDCSDDNDDFQSAPNSPMMNSKVTESKKIITSPKKHKEESTSTKPDNVNTSSNHKATDESLSSTSTKKDTSFIADDPLLLRSRAQKGVTKKRHVSFSTDDDDEFDFDTQASVEKVLEELTKKKESKLQPKDSLPKCSAFPSPMEKMFKYKASPPSKTKQETSKTKQESAPSTGRTGIHDFPATSSLGSAIRSFGRSITGRASGTPIAPPKRTHSPSPPPISSPTSPRRRSSISPIMPYMSLFSNSLSSADSDEEVLVYPFDRKKAVIIKNSDIARIEHDRFLNDTIMDAYPKILQDEHPRDEIYTFSSFFFTRLTQADNNTTPENTYNIKYENVKRWTDKINIFDKDYIIIPIEQNHHWFLAIVTNPGYCVGRDFEDDDELMIAEGIDDVPKSVKKNRSYITLLDSLGSDRELCYQQVCAYLKEEAVNRLKIDPLEFKTPVYIKGRPPLQTNLTDCGVHCLYCIKRLYQNPKLVQTALTSPSARNDDIWEPNLVSLFRQKLTNIFKDKAKEYKAYKKAEPKTTELASQNEEIIIDEAKK